MTINSTLTSVFPEEFNERFSWHMSTCTHVTTIVEPTATMESTNSPHNFTSMAALPSDKVTVRLFVLLLCITSDTCIQKNKQNTCTNLTNCCHLVLNLHIN